jgi:hypothetical protein
VDALQFGFRLVFVELGPIPHVLSGDFSGAWGKTFFEKLAKRRFSEDDAHLVLIVL